MSIFQDALELSQEEFNKLLLRLRTSYYHNTQEISDEEYDSLLELYRNRFDKNYESVGAPIQKETKKKTIKLPRYMQSLDKIKDTETKKFDNWIKKYPGPYVVSDKLDGISCGMWGKKTFTQGDGNIGVDISHLGDVLGNKNIEGLPRGEIVISKRVFMEKYKNAYSNSRNMVTGVVGRKQESNETKDLCFYAYNWSPVPQKNTPQPLSPLDQFKYLEGYFRVPFYKRVDSLSIDYLKKLYTIRKQEADYEMDGIVVYQNSWEDIVKGEMTPKNAFAFKMDGQTVNTTIQKIEWEVSKHGKIKPVAHFNEVNLGVNINKSTAFSAKFVLQNNLGPGSIITVVRSGEVIPYIKNVIKSTTAQLPDFPWRWCKTMEMSMVDNVKGNPPENSKVEIIDGKQYYVWEKISDVDIEIVNEDTTQTKKMDKQRLVHFFKTLKAKHVGEETIDKLMSHGYSDLSKLLKLTKRDVMGIEGFKEKSSERLIESIQGCIKDISIARLVSATGILGEGIGERKFQTIIDVYPDFLEQTNDKDLHEVEKMIKKVGGFDKKAVCIASNVKHLKTFLQDHPQIVLQKHHKSSSIESELNGKTVVFTGFRDENLESKIKSCGGKVSTSVSKNTSYLVKRGSETSTKEVKAMNIKTISIYSLEEFIKKFKLHIN